MGQGQGLGRGVGAVQKACLLCSSFSELEIIRDHVRYFLTSVGG
jgi:hypothetical protein